MHSLNEDSRSTLLTKGKSGDNYAPENQLYGKNRYERRLRSKVSHSVKEFNAMNMDRLFRDNILDINIDVAGETDNYVVKISFTGFLDELHRQVKGNPDIQIDAKMVTLALINAFNGEDVYIHCSCPDFRYRLGYWATKNNLTTYSLVKTSRKSKVTSADNNDENRPSDITNPNDTKGPGCKHIMLVLSNRKWLAKVASVITNYVRYMEKNYAKLYADIIYPAIYEGKYTEPVQLDLLADVENRDEDELVSDKDTLDTANKWAVTKNQFKKGNEYRFKPLNDLEGQAQLFNDENEMSDTER